QDTSGLRRGVEGDDGEGAQDVLGLARAAVHGAGEDRAPRGAAAHDDRQDRLRALVARRRRMNAKEVGKRCAALAGDARWEELARSGALGLPIAKELGGGGAT